MTEDIREPCGIFQRFDLSLDADPTDPNVVHIVVPDALLNFGFGKGTLSAIADQFLVDAMPTYAALFVRGHAGSY